MKNRIALLGTGFLTLFAAAMLMGVDISDVSIDGAQKNKINERLSTISLTPIIVGVVSNSSLIYTLGTTNQFDYLTANHLTVNQDATFTGGIYLPTTSLTNIVSGAINGNAGRIFNYVEISADTITGSSEVRQGTSPDFLRYSSYGGSGEIIAAHAYQSEGANAGIIFLPQSDSGANAHVTFYQFYTPSGGTTTWHPILDVFGGVITHGTIGGTNDVALNHYGPVLVGGDLTVTGAINQVPLTFNLSMNTITSSNMMTFAHATVPAGKTVTINYVQSLNQNGTVPGVNQLVRIYDATAASTLLATNGNWVGTITIPAGNRWYAAFENNSTTNIVSSASIHGNLK